MYSMCIFRNFLYRNFFQKKINNSIVINRELNIMNVKVKNVPFYERYESIDFKPKVVD